jgi:hypothetical protein
MTDSTDDSMWLSYAELEELETDGIRPLGDLYGRGSGDFNITHVSKDLTFV